MNVDEMLGGVRDALRAQTVFGEAVERDGVTTAGGVLALRLLLVRR